MPLPGSGVGLAEQHDHTYEKGLMCRDSATALQRPNGLLECGPRSRCSAFNNLAAAPDGFLDVLQLPPHSGPQGI
jgi:hypothetical protein